MRTIVGWGMSRCCPPRSGIEPVGCPGRMPCLRPADTETTRRPQAEPSRLSRRRKCHGPCLIGRRRRNSSIVIPGGMSLASYMNPSEATSVDADAVVADAAILIPATRLMHAQAPHDRCAEDRAGTRGGLPKWNRLPYRPPAVPCPHAHRVARKRAVSVPRRSLLGALVRASRVQTILWRRAV
jgi:hypothetical protein